MPPFDPPNGHVADRALVGHERGQRHDLVLIDHAAVADAALQGLAVVAVLGAPASKMTYLSSIFTGNCM
jgi:hypothetical protein